RFLDPPSGLFRPSTSNPAADLNAVATLLLSNLLKQLGELPILIDREAPSERAPIFVKRLRDQAWGTVPHRNRRKDSNPLSTRANIQIDAPVAIDPLQNLSEAP